MCESGGGRPGLLVLNSPDGLCMDLTRRSIVLNSPDGLCMDLTRRSSVSETRINVSGETIATHVKLVTLLDSKNKIALFQTFRNHVVFRCCCCCFVFVFSFIVPVPFFIFLFLIIVFTLTNSVHVCACVVLYLFHYTNFIQSSATDTMNAMLCLYIIYELCFFRFFSSFFLSYYYYYYSFAQINLIEVQIMINCAHLISYCNGSHSDYDDNWENNNNTHTHTHTHTHTYIYIYIYIYTTNNTTHTHYTPHTLQRTLLIYTHTH